MGIRRIVGMGAVGAATAVGAVVVKRALPPARIPAFPLPYDAVTPAGSLEFAAALAAAPRVAKSASATPFATAMSFNVEPLLHGTAYFPRMLEEIRGASSSVSLLMYGFKPGDIGEEFKAALIERREAGVEVRLAIDAIGSEVRGQSKQLYREIVAAGIPVVMNRGMMPDVTGPLGGGGRIAWPTQDMGAFDHRKMLIVDGRVAFVGGTGIEDHFNDERFYDVMVRVEGPVVTQLQALFVAGYRHQGGTVPTDPAGLGHLFPTLPEPENGVPTTILANVPGTGHYPISDAIEMGLDAAERRVDIVNPYVSDHAIIDKLVAAARRGVAVRIVIPGKPTPPYPAAAFRHNYPRLLDAGVRILAHPDMAHAKVVVVDDRALVGGCNLDALSLYRNWELDLLFDDAAVAEAVKTLIVDRFAEVATPVTVETEPKQKLWDAAMDRISPLL
jgi:cardiolipin synthase